MKNSLGRRDIIKITAVAGAALLGKSILDRVPAEGSLTALRDTRLMMGTLIHLTVLSEDAPNGRAAIKATFNEMERLITIFDHRHPNTPLTQLNQRGELSNPPTELFDILQQSLDIYLITGGAFDVTVKPLMDLYQPSRPLPTQQAIARALELVGSEKLCISSDRIAFSQSGMAIILDGIAKGYIVDKGVDTLRRWGFPNVFLEAGGDLMAKGLKDEGSEWKVGLQSPRESGGNLLATFRIHDRAIATSGDYIQYFSADLLHHHILDPHRGLSPAELASVTIFSKRTALSDALATGIMVMGVEKGMDLIESTPGLEGVLVTKDLVQIRSTGLPDQKKGLSAS